MKRFFSISFLLLLASLMQAKSLVFMLKDGTMAYFPIVAAQRPVLRFADGKVSVETQSYLFTDIQEFRISEDDGPTGIRPAESRPKLVDNDLWVSIETKVSVYDSNGRKQPVGLAKSAGGQVVRLAPLPSGLYVVHVGKTAFKYVKK